MIAYTKNADKTINVLGGSPDVNKLKKIFAGQNFLVCNDDEITHCANGTTMLTADVDVEAEEKAQAKKGKREKIEQLNADYESARFELGKYYMEAFLDGDVDSQKELKTELDNVKAQYNADLNDLMNE